VSPRPGTALEEPGTDAARDTFTRHVAPLLAARPDLWPAASSSAAAAGDGSGAAAGDAGLELFVRAAGAACPCRTAVPPVVTVVPPAVLRYRVSSGWLCTAAGPAWRVAGGTLTMTGVRSPAAGLVQSRAFHLEAENWVLGAKEVR
jgi:hypothetical protein